jgi:putative ABC transport system ATP-binding protein
MNALSMKEVRKSYRVGGSQVQALRGVSLEVAVGEMLALTGPSGSGKSTLLNLCGLVDAPDAGTREIEGTVVDRYSPSRLTQLRRERIGFVFQSFNLVPVMNAYENVEYPLLLLGTPAAERKKRIWEVLDRVGLAELGRRLPDALSGGQRQRVAIARALVKSPVLVIADEPTGNLDSATAMQIVELLRELTRERGVAAVIATHDERMTRHCDRVLRLVDGEMQGQPLQGQPLQGQPQRAAR